jgi:uncharacterized protein YidB (DUF937 family)
MGLLDSILGGLSGSGGASRVPTSSATSPMVKAILLLLAAKAAQSMTSRSGATHTGNISGSAGVDGGPLGGVLGGQAGGQGGGLGSGLGGNLGGGLGGLLSGGLGGLLGGAASSGVLGGFLDQLRGRGFGDHVDSWVGTGQNKRIPPDEMARALGPDAVSELEQHTGMPRDQLLAELSHELPDSVDQLTPGGRVPTDEEIWSGQKS